MWLISRHIRQALLVLNKSSGWGTHFARNTRHEYEPKNFDSVPSSNFAPLLNTKKCRSGLSRRISLAHQRCNIWPREATRGRRRSKLREISEHRAERMAALVRLQRRKHNLIIMYGHISRMSPCLGQCTRGWCSVPTRFWHSGGVLHADIPGDFGRIWGPTSSTWWFDRRDHLDAIFATLRGTCAYHCDLWFFPEKFPQFCFYWLKDWEALVNFTFSQKIFGENFTSWYLSNILILSHSYN